MMDYSRQCGISSPMDLCIQKTHIYIIGLGNTGSHVSNILSRMGFHNFTLIDSDIVESWNILASTYTPEDIGKYKVTASTELIKNNLDSWHIIEHKKRISQVKNIIFEPNNTNIIFACVDNMNARREIFKKFSSTFSWLIDIRVGSSSIIIDCVDLLAQNTEYAESLKTEGLKSPCNAKFSIATNSMVASVGCFCALDIAKNGIPKNKSISASFENGYTHWIGG